VAMSMLAGSLAGTNKAKIICYFPKFFFLKDFVKYFFSYLNPLNIFYVYKSISNNNFIMPIQKKNNNQNVNLIVKNKNDILKIKYKNILIGDLIYDEYLRNFNEITIDINKKNFKDFLSRSSNLISYWENYFDNNKKNIKGVVTSHSVYLIALVGRIALAYDVPVFVAGWTQINKINKKNLSRYPNPDYYKRDFKNFYKNKKKKYLDEAKKNLKLRLSGKKDVLRNISLKIDPVYSTRVTKKFLFKDNKKINVLIASHCFSDAPHFYGKIIFSDFYEWISYLGKKAKQKNYNFYFKIHPAHHERNKEKIDKLLLKYSDLYLVPNGVTHKQIIPNIDVALTVYGSIAHEYPLQGIPVVTAGENPQQGYDFCYNPKTFKDYNRIIDNLEKCKVRKNIKKSIYEFYFMHYLTDYFILGDEKISAENISKLSIYKILMKKIEHRNFYEEKNKIFTNFILSKKRRILFDAE